MKTAGWNDLSLIGKAGVVDCDDDESSTRFSLSFNNSCKEKNWNNEQQRLQPAIFHIGYFSCNYNNKKDEKKKQQISLDELLMKTALSISLPGKS